MEEKTITAGQAIDILGILSKASADKIQLILESELLEDLCNGNITWVNRNEFRQLLGLDSLISTYDDSCVEHLGTVMIPATIERFVINERFVFDLDTVRNDKIKIISPFNDFKKSFNGKKETPIGEHELCYAKPIEDSMEDYSSLISEVGKKIETTLAELVSLVEKQCNGETDVLLEDGSLNIFYIRSRKKILHLVYIMKKIYMYEQEWKIFCKPVDLRCFSKDCNIRIFFRK